MARPAHTRFLLTGLVCVCASACESRDSCVEWQEPAAIEVDGASVDLLAVHDGLIGGAEGILIARGEGLTLPPEAADTRILALHQLPRFSAGNARVDYIAAGTQGTVLHGIGTGGSLPESWSKVELETNANFHAIVSFEQSDNIPEQHLAVIGEGAVFELMPLYGEGLEILYEWRPAEAPADGWGTLRSAGGREYGGAPVAVGDGGRYITRSGNYAVPQWEAEDIGTTADLLAYCTPDSGERVLGKGGTMRIHANTVPWTEVDLGTDEDLIACSDRLVLTASGRVLDVEYRRNEAPLITELLSEPGLRAIEDRREVLGEPNCVVGVGEAGVALELCQCPPTLGASMAMLGLSPL